MAYSTSNTYQMKREFIFFQKISRKLPKPKRKFMADMNFDILSRHLAKRIPSSTLKAYLSLVKNGIILLLPADKGYLRHTELCPKRSPTLAFEPVS